METFKVLRTFSPGKYSDSELVIKTNHIEDKLDGNPNFPDVGTLLAPVTKAKTDFISALNKVENGKTEDTAKKNSMRAILEQTLKDLADYIQLKSKGVEAIILSSGFDTNKKPTVVGPLARPEGLLVRPGNNKGNVIVSCEVIENAEFYEFAITESPINVNSIWIPKTSTKRKLEIGGLVSGKQYAFRVAGAGSDPSRIWSDEILSFVL
ncbi:MAG: hypothetical protein GZ094_21250 [Mariniphaga sp.]|nr:hypothetical protein [Mariniphaga sp.]